MGAITTLSNDTLVDNVKKGVTAAKLKAIHSLIDTEITNKLNEILRPISVVGVSASSILNVANPYPSNTLSKIAVYKQVYVNGIETEVGYEEIIPTKITKNVALQNDSYKIEGLADGKYHIIFNPAAVFTPYVNS